jgi:hypothetical protein
MRWFHLFAAGLWLVTAGLLSSSSAQVSIAPARATDDVLIKFKHAARLESPVQKANDMLPVLLQSLHLPVGAELREPVVSQWLRETKVTAPGLDLDRFLYSHLPPGLEPDGGGTGGSTIPNDLKGRSDRAAGPKDTSPGQAK